MINQSKKIFLVFALILSFGTTTKAADLTEGEAIWKQNCTACHQIKGVLIGPGLGDIHLRRDEAWLIPWIKNSQAVIKSGDKYAVELYAKYNKVAMPSYSLSDDQIKNTLAYIRAEYDKVPAATAGVAGVAGTGSVDDGKISNYTLSALAVFIVVLLLIVLVLSKVIKTLEKIILKNREEKVLVAVENVPSETIKPSKLDGVKTNLKKLAGNKKFILITIILFIVGFSSISWIQLSNVGVQQYYQPKQPIAFSHQLHAGTYQMNCQYCHSGAWKSKNASIPSANVCMNCHNYVQLTEKYNGQISPEIKKIYTALDYNPETRTYGENTQPIEWVRIHNLPDFSYFNHSQHVKVAGLECQQCHGPVQEMEEVYQYSRLTMGWCINCHRETEVNYKGNAYYEREIKAHEALKKGEKITAAALGGLECAKCHY